MAIRFVLLYHPKVLKEDIAIISPTWKENIRLAIEEKLVVAPETFGKPLRQSLRGYRKLRVGDYRVVFRLEGDVVFILAILHRSVVYKQIMKRDTE